MRRKEGVLALPSDAIQSDRDGSYVLAVLKAEPGASPGMMRVIRSEKRRVEVGLEGDALVEVVSGLTEGDKVAFQPIEEAAHSGRQNMGSPFGGGFGGPGGPGPGGPPPGGGGPGR